MKTLSDLFIRPDSIVAEGFHLQFFFKLYNLSPSFAAKDNFCLSSKLITVKLHACRGFTTYDWQRFIVVLSISRFCLIFTRNKFCSVGNASKDLSASAKFASRSGDKHDRISSYISFVLYPLRACFPTEQSVGKASLFVKYHELRYQYC